MRLKRWAAFVILPALAWAVLSLAALVGHAWAQQATPRWIASQVTVSTTATITAVARSNRQTVTIQNHGTTVAYCGPDSGVTTANGFRLPGVDGASLTLATSAIIYCIVGAGTQAVSVAETF